jgi:hypothetical protein
MSDDTRESHTHRPDDEAADDHTADANFIQDTVLEVNELMGVRTALEQYRDQVAAAGIDGLDPVAKQIMRVNLQQLKLSRNAIGLESFDLSKDTLSVEDFAESLSNLGEKIMALINRLIEMAKQFATKMMAGLETVKTQAEELMDSIRNKKRGPAKRVSQEFHEGDQTITIDNPGILFANGKFCLDDCRAEQEVIKFFIQQWPKYAIEQISRAKKMVGEYDVESGNSENFESNAGFIGNHESLVKGITEAVLPGNKEIAFKYVALGPELVDSEHATKPPASHTYEVRTEVEMTGTLRKNVATMNALGSMYKEEAAVLQEMSTLAESLNKLEGRRGETIFKGARDALDAISNMMMDLITRLKPNYDPIVRHLARVGTARNAAVRKEFDAAV